MDRKKYIDKLTDQLKDWDDELITLESKVDMVKSELKIEYQKQLLDVKKKIESAKSKLKELKNTNGTTFDEIKTAASKSFRELGESIEIAVQKYK